MSEEMKKAQSAFDYLYRTVQEEKRWDEMCISAIASGDHDELCGVGIEPMAVRDPVDKIKIHSYWQGRAHLCENLLMIMDARIAASLRLRTDPSPARELKIVVNNTKPRGNGAELIKSQIKGA